MKFKNVRLLKILLVSLLALILDQVSKLFISSWMDLGDSVKVIGSFFQLTYIHNPKGIFGLSMGGKTLHTAFSVVAIAFVIIVLWQALALRVLPRLALAMILGGAVGNLIDRIRLGEVVDFLDFGIGNLRWPVFNVADIWVTVGAILLAFRYVLKKDVEYGEKS